MRRSRVLVRRSPGRPSGGAVAPRPEVGQRERGRPPARLPASHLSRQRQNTRSCPARGATALRLSVRRERASSRYRQAPSSNAERNRGCHHQGRRARARARPHLALPGSRGRRDRAVGARVACAR
jgi:hypothetical protein